MKNGAGGDAMDGGDGIDTLSLAANGFGVTLNMITGQMQGSDCTGDYAVNFENVVGSSYGDYIVGTTGANQLQLGGGNDTATGSLGADTIDGGAGQDFISCSNAQSGITLALDSLWDAATSSWYGVASGDALAAGDRLISVEMVNGSNHADVLTAGKASTYQGGGQGADLLTGHAGADTIYGGEGNDAISGGAGNDWLDGGYGDDTITAGVGNGYMTGDQGADVFVFSAAGFVAGEVDRIATFDPTADSIRVEGAALKSIMSVAGAGGVELHMTLAAGGEFVLRFDGGLTSAEVMSHVT